MYMLQKWVIVDVVLLMNTSMHVGIMEQGVGTEEAAKGRGVAPSHKKNPQRLRLCRVRRTA